MLWGVVRRLEWIRGLREGLLQVGFLALVYEIWHFTVFLFAYARSEKKG
jgi:hypothetical protein